MVRRLVSAIALVGSLIGTSASPEVSQSLRYDKLKARMVRMGSWFISYNKDFPPYQMSMLVVADEGCLLEFQCPMGEGLPDRPEIGRYYWKNPPEEGERLRQLMLRAEAEQATVKDPPSLPGTRFLTFGLGKKGVDEVDPLTVVPLRRPLTPTVAAFDEAMLTLARKVVDHPYTTLRAKGTLHTKELAPDGELVARLELSNTGIFPVVAYNPAFRASPAKVMVSIEERKDEFQYLDVTPDEMAASTGTSTAQQLAPTAEAKIKLGPGDVLALSIRVRKHIYLRKGRHAVELRYTSSNHGLEEGEGLAGFVDVVAGTLEIQKAVSHK